MTCDDFKLGTYRHWRDSALYTAIMLVTHHDTRLPMVLYVSHLKGCVNCRPLRGWQADPDGFDPLVHDPDGFLDEVTWPDGRVASRFELVKEATPQLATEAALRVDATAANESDPRCYGCGGLRSAHGADGRSMVGWPNCRQFRGERPNWYPEGKGIEER